MLAEKIVSYKDKIPTPHINTFAIIFFLILMLILILNALNILEWGVWGFLLKFWPIFLTMAFLQYLARKSETASKIILALALGITLAIISFSFAPFSPKISIWLKNLNPLTYSIRNMLGLNLGEKVASSENIKAENYQDVSERDINISISSGKFNLTDNPGTDHLIIKSEYYQNYGKPNITTQMNKNILLIDLKTQKSLKPFFGAGEDTIYDISIGNPEVKTSLDLDVGAATFDAIFSFLNINNLKIDVGAGTALVKFNKLPPPKCKLSFNVGAGNLKIKFPFDTYAKVNYSVGAGVLNINSETFSRNGTYITPSFKITKDPIEIDLLIGAGTILIDTTGTN